MLIISDASQFIQYATAETSLGLIVAAINQAGVCAIAVADTPDLLTRYLQKTFPTSGLHQADEPLKPILAKLVRFVEAPNQALDLTLDMRGTAFQKQVWQALTLIPAGSTASYSDIALQIGSPKALRAVANACAANKLALAIPCHRVVRADGGISGYRWGVDRKRELLRREQQAALPN